MPSTWETEPEPSTRFGGWLRNFLTAAPPEDRRFYVSTWLWLRLLGLTYIAAFVSFGVQAQGLIGADGIMPAASTMQFVRLRGFGFSDFPTLSWLSPSDSATTAQWVLGVICGIVLAAGISNIIVIFLAWLLYLSVTTIGSDFMAFQWDNLLLECGALSVLLGGFGRTAVGGRGCIWAFRFLLFRILFSSGVVKFVTSGDEAWGSLAALRYHYETQPLPTWVGWWAHQLPGWFHQLSVASVFFLQCVLPFAFFLTRKLRLVAAVGMLVLQLLIALTGNYGFFNFLTASLVVFLIDDRTWRGLGVRQRILGSSLLRTRTAVGLVAIALGFLPMTRTLQLRRGSTSLERHISPLRSLNPYGLFAVMTTHRPEVVIEGSNDGIEWKEYVFKYKAGPVERGPMFVAPHMPRLDWVMWFLALGRPEQADWLAGLFAGLFEGKQPVLDLLEVVPFKEPPRFLRAQLYEYHFESLDVRVETGAWWRRELQGEFVPAIER